MKREIRNMARSRCPGLSVSKQVRMKNPSGVAILHTGTTRILDDARDHDQLLKHGLSERHSSENILQSRQHLVDDLVW